MLEVDTGAFPPGAKEVCRHALLDQELGAFEKALAGGAAVAPAHRALVGQGEVNLSQFDKSRYSPQASVRKRFCWYFINIFFFVNPLNASYKLKIFLLELFGARIGENLIIKPNVNIKYPWLLEMGHNVWLGEKAWIDNLVKVKIGNNVCISQGAYLMTGNHNYQKQTFDLIAGEIVIEDGVWVGAKAIVCPGVTLKTHSVLTAGSVITEDTEPYGIYQGNPATLARKRVIE